jgi:hypothetical protein
MFPSVTLSQKTQISEEDVKLASRDMNGFIALKCLIARETAKICQVLLAGESL